MPATLSKAVPQWLRRYLNTSPLLMRNVKVLQSWIETILGPLRRRNVLSLTWDIVKWVLGLNLTVLRSTYSLISWILGWVNYLIAPKMLWALLRRHALALFVIFCVNVVYRTVFAGWVTSLRHRFMVRLLDPQSQRMHALLSKDLEEAKTFTQWSKAAQQLDRIEGLDAWKNLNESVDYDYRKIIKDLWELRRKFDARDVYGLMWYIRSSVSRSMVGITSHKLYGTLRTGTKQLIEDFLDELTRALQLIAVDNTIMIDEKMAFFNETRHAFGRSALLLSGGATLGLYHTGVVKALHECRLLPRVISGSSVGSIIAAMVGTRTDKELAELFDSENPQFDLSFFSPETVASKIRRLRRDGNLLDIKDLAKAVRSNVPGLTFREAYDRTNRILNIVVTPAASAGNMDQARLLNYLTAPNVLVWSAALARYVRTHVCLCV